MVALQLNLRTCINKNKPHIEVALATEENTSVHYRPHLNGYSRTKLCVLGSIGDICCGEEPFVTMGLYYLHR